MKVFQYLQKKGQVCPQYQDKAPILFFFFT